MGVTKKRAAQNKRRILDVAERLFRQKGVSAVGLAELMKKAGFTQGGFYNHFASKEALVSEVISKAMDKGQQELRSAIACSQEMGISSIANQIEWYLSAEHRDDIRCGCPMAGFAGEIPHLPKGQKIAYAEALESTLGQLEKMLMEVDSGLTTEEVRTRAISLYSQMVGSVLLSRAVSAGKPALADEIIDSVRLNMLNGLSSPHSSSRKV